VGDSSSVLPASTPAPVTLAEARRNRLLAALDNETLVAVVACSEHVSLAEHSLLYDAGDPMTHVDFPLSGLVSVMVTSREGNAVEVGPIGCDGMIGLPVVLGGGTDPLEASARIAPVEAVRLAASAFQTLLKQYPSLERVLRLYAQWSYYLVAQSVLCARLHPLEERMARYLLMCCDRLGQSHFSLTHDSLAEMLAVRRASVTIALGALRRSGLIDSAHGTITILDQAELEQGACECNRLALEEYHRLLSQELQADRPPIAASGSGAVYPERAQRVIQHHSSSR
jgi:CRP-like cAMP-binding protein